VVGLCFVIFWLKETGAKTASEILVKISTGHKILDTLYYLPKVEDEWKVMAQHLKTPRRFLIALLVPNSITNCYTGNNSYYPTGCDDN